MSHRPPQPTQATTIPGPVTQPRKQTAPALVYLAMPGALRILPLQLTDQSQRDGFCIGEGGLVVVALTQRERSGKL